MNTLIVLSIIGLAIATTLYITRSSATYSSYTTAPSVYQHNLKVLQTMHVSDAKTTDSSFNNFKLVDATGPERVYLPVGSIPDSHNRYPTYIVKGTNYQFYVPSDDGRLVASNSYYGDYRSYEDFMQTLFVENIDGLVPYCSDDILPENKHAILTKAIKDLQIDYDKFTSIYYHPATANSKANEIKRLQDLLASTVGKTHPELLL